MACFAAGQTPDDRPATADALAKSAVFRVQYSYRSGVLSLVNYPELLLLGAIAGFTIFLGLPLAVIRNINARKKGFLNAVAIGILIFLTVDVFSHAWESVQDIVKGVALGTSTTEYSMLAFVAMFGGIAIGLLGLTWYGKRYMHGASLRPRVTASATAATAVKDSNRSLNCSSCNR